MPIFFLFKIIESKLNVILPLVSLYLSIVFLIAEYAYKEKPLIKTILAVNDFLYTIFSIKLFYTSKQMRL